MAKKKSNENGKNENSKEESNVIQSEVEEDLKDLNYERLKFIGTIGAILGFSAGLIFADIHYTKIYLFVWTLGGLIISLCLYAIFAGKNSLMKYIFHS